MNKAKTRPAFCTDEHLVFLDDLRDSGATNMFGAAPWLRDTFPDLRTSQCRDIVLYWMDTFDDESR